MSQSKQVAADPLIADLTQAKALYEAGQLKEADALCRSILARDKRNFGALHISAYVRHREGDLRSAVALLKKAMEFYPNESSIAVSLGLMHLEQKDEEQAASAFQKALEIKPSNSEALKNLAPLLAKKNPRRAAECYVAYIMNHPDDTHMKQNFSNFCMEAVFLDFDPVIKNAILICLQDEKVDPRFLGRSWLAQFFNDSELTGFTALRALDYGDFKMRFKAEMLLPVLDTPFLTLAMRKFLLADPEHENLMNHLRRFLLETVMDDPATKSFVQHKELFLAMAHMSWHNEHVFYTSDAENAALDGVQKTIEADDFAALSDAAMAQLIVYSFYRPVHKLKNAAAIEAAFQKRKDADCALFVQHCLSEPLEEAEIKKNIPACTKISDEISQMVRAQYEENPYPRWKVIPPVPANQRNHNKMDVLVAGCGSGVQPIQVKMVTPNAIIHSVDLSLSSLAYAIRESRAHGFKDMRFEQADILELGSIGVQYDRIYCSGVLHHMQDPEAGLAVLTSILKPGGQMRLALYSDLARQPVVQARARIAEGDYSATADGIRRFRHDMMQQYMAGDKQAKAALNFMRWRDMYSLSDCRDMAFHVQEHRYSLVQIADMLERHGLRLTGLSIDQFDLLNKFKAQHPEEGALLDLQKWHAFEQGHPDMFGRMYQFSVAHKAA